MKIAFAIVLIWGLMTFVHSDDKIRVEKMAPTTFEAMFDLVGSKAYDKITLDCQSFIHGVSLYKGSHQIKHYYLEIDECSDLYTLLRDRSEQGVVSCLSLMEAPRKISVGDDLKGCL